MYDDFLKNSLLLNAIQTNLIEDLNNNICELKQMRQEQIDNTSSVNFEEETTIEDHQFDFDFEDDFDF